MDIKQLVPELVVDDLPRSIEFYTDELGFDLLAKAPEEGKPTWAELGTGSIRLMMQEREETINEMPKLSNTPRGGIMIFVLRLAQIEQVREIAERYSGDERVVLPIRETDYGTVEFALTDPDGYVILFSGE